MKKTFLAILAAAAMVACAQEEVLRTQGPVQIGFDGAYVDNAVRAEDPSTTTDNLAAFDVWGYMDNGDGNVFTREEVKKSGSAWTYQNKQYWVPTHTYRFFALAPAQSNNVNIALADDAYADGIATLTFTNVNGTEDLLYASQENVAAPAQGATTADPVKFAFDHLLSKVKFVFNNGVENTNAYIKVTNIEMVVPEQGTIALNLQSNYAWKNHTGAKELSFGHLLNGTKVAGLKNGDSDYERLTIPAPAAQTYTVEFDVEFFMGDVSASTSHKTITVTNVALEPGKAYIFSATLNADNVADNALIPIEFDVTAVHEWVDGGTNELPKYAESEAALAAAILAAKDGETVALASDITLSKALTVKNNVKLDLAGHTLTVENSDFVNEGTLVLENGTVSGVDSQDGRRALVNKGTLTLKNVTLDQVYQQGGAALINDGATAVAVLDGVTINSQNMAISNKNGATMTINSGNFYCLSTGRGEGKVSYAVNNQLGSTLTVNGGYFEGGHGVIASTEASKTYLNAGKYHCLSNYSPGSDWVLYANGTGSVIEYKSACELSNVHTPNISCTQDGGEIKLVD